MQSDQVSKLIFYRKSGRNIPPAFFYLLGDGYLKRLMLFMTILFFVLPKNEVSAAGKIVDLYDPYNLVTSSIYHKDWGSYDAYMIDVSSRRAVSVKFSTYTDDSFTKVENSHSKTNQDLGLTHFDGMGFNCNSPYIGELYDSSGDLLVRAKVVITGLKKPACDDESGDSGGNDGSGNITCDICAALKEIRSSLNANNNKLDSIINKIPPPPNWQEVADTMSNTIVPQLVGDTRVMLDDLLGRAPAPPPMPMQPGAPEDLAAPDTSKMPDEPKVDLPPEKDDNSFTAEDVMKEAEELEYVEPDEEDSGFNLTIDPFEQLENPGSPGEPKEPEDPGNPGIPKEPDIPESPGTPNQEVEAPPKPNTPDFNPGSPGTPNDDIGSPGKPNQGDFSPSNPGGDIGTPPEHYNPS